MVIMGRGRTYEPETCAGSLMSALAKMGNRATAQSLFEQVKKLGHWTDENIWTEMLSHTINCPPAHHRFPMITPAQHSSSCARTATTSCMTPPGTGDLNRGRGWFKNLYLFLMKERCRNEERSMWINRILRILNTPVTILLFIPEVITTFLLGIIIAIPPVGLAYVFLMTLIWLPFYGFMVGVSWLYTKVPLIGAPLALVGIPLVILIDAFLQLMPNPDKADKYNKATVCESFPFSMPSQIVGDLRP